MIPVPNPIPTPVNFNEICRRPGLVWLRANRISSKFPSYWLGIQPALADGFSNRCGWWAMHIEDGAVDHYRSKKNHRRLTYSWSNYRYIAGTVNGSKKNHDDAVLDPFEIGPGWFEVLLPSMLLVKTALLPLNLRVKADFTLKQLKLRDGAKVLRSRKRWYEGYKNGKITMAGLEDYAPLIATAVKRLEALGQPLP